MKRLRITYFIITICIIILGLAVRLGHSHLPGVVNLYAGDALYAVMVFYGYNFIFPIKKRIDKAGYAIITCYLIEFLQLYKAQWIVATRATLPGRLILGQGFLWSDILAYTVGIALACCVDIFWHPRTKIGS